GGGPGGGGGGAGPAARPPALGRRRLGRRLAFRLCGQGGFRLGGRPGRLVGRGRRHRGRREQVLALREGQVVKVLDVGDVRALPRRLAPRPVFLAPVAAAPVAAAIPVAVPVAVAAGAAPLAAALAAALLQVAVVGGLDVGDVQEAVAADAEIDERRLDARLDVDDAALVDVADVALVAGALHVQLLEDAVLQDGDAALLGLQHVDQHFLFHALDYLRE